MTCHKNCTSSWRTVLVCAALTQIVFCSQVEAIARVVKRSQEDCTSNCQAGCNQCSTTSVNCCPYSNCQDNSCCCCSPYPYPNPCPNQRIVYRRDPCSPRSCSPYPYTGSCSPCYPYPYPYTGSCSPCSSSPSPYTSASCPYPSCDSYRYPNYYTCPNSYCCSDCMQNPSYCPYSFPPFCCDKPNKKIKLQVIETMEYPQCEGRISCQKGGPKETCKVVPENCLDQFLEEYDLEEGEYRICPCPKWKIPKYYCVKFYKKPCQCKNKGKEKTAKNDKKGEKCQKPSETKDKEKDSGNCC